jgi:hypothetical protein
MSTKALLLYDTRTWDASTVTASTSASGMAASRVLHDLVSRKWRSTSKTGNTLTFDLGSAFSTTLFGIFGHNFTSGATVTLAANTSNSWGAPAWGPTTLTVATDGDSRVLPRLVYKLSQSYRWWQLSVDDSGNTSNYVEIGRIMAGQYYEFTRNFARRARITHVDPTPIKHIPGSVENIEDLTYLARFRQIRVDFPLRTVTEQRKINALFGLRGNSRPVVLCLDYDNYPSEQSAYCYIVSDLDTEWRMDTSWNTMTLVFEEKTR